VHPLVSLDAPTDSLAARRRRDPVLILNPLDRRVTRRGGFPVLPGAFPVVGHIPAVATNLLGLMRHAEREVGHAFWIDSGFGARNITCLDPEVFSILKNKVTTSTYLQGLLPDLFGISLIAQDGAVHQHMRSAMTGPFLPRGLTAAEVGPLLAELIERRMRVWRDRRTVTVLAETRELVLALMFRLLGVAETNLSAWRRNYEDFMLLAINLPLDLPGTPRHRGRRAKAWLDEHLLAIIAEARTRPSKGFLSALVAGRDEGGAGLSDAELVDNLRLLVLAGHETSASTMAWMVIMLADRPDVWDALCDEATKAGGTPQSPKEVREFPYAEAVFRETLRLHPPVASDARKALVDFELAGGTVPAGEMVNISIIHLSRHPSLYDRPDEFRPERWLDRSDRSDGVSPIELVQFGGGPHFCLGYHLAWMEIVQFGVALARAMRSAGLRPSITGPRPKMRYLPLLHPSAGTRIAFG
jgi:cytochrome P450